MLLKIFCYNAGVQKNKLSELRNRHRKDINDLRYHDYVKFVRSFRGNDCENELCSNRGEFWPTEVHHINYDATDWMNWHLWDYPVWSVQVLCRPCHIMATINQANKRQEYQEVKRLVTDLKRMQDQMFLHFPQSA